MASKAALVWLCLLAVLSSSVAQHETLRNNCTSQLFEDVSNNLKVAIGCGENLPPAMTAEQTAALLQSMKSLSDSLHKQQLKECHGALPKTCPDAEVPVNGGLTCVTVNNKRYCKPLCNHGYDFAFLRRSRLYDECSEQTRHKWNTQYVGGNKLAVCSEASIQVSGANSAYFPKDQDCLVTKSSIQLLNNTIEVFTTELKNQGIQGKPQYPCLVCG
ncbi:uncharacterized protein si:ch1073-126c3.2 [Channa argus]|uniref:uncharacterized protein si:ch1073-126c3.2 n=1 Tax=Channa argus TaxID=215402 RepID=UPI002946EB89|nr:hypothetical protein Q8A73_001070 [Channa argus]